MAIIVSAMAKEKIFTEVSAFGVGLINGMIGKARPGAALLTTVVTAAGGLLGSLMTSGRTADIMEGMAAGSLGALGYSIPSWFSASTGTSRAPVSGIRSIKALEAPKQVAGSNKSVQVGSRYPAEPREKEFKRVMLV